ncbi:Serine/threonine-protein kinase ppk15 [Psilocybe cubensis]|uniref:Serine/threonine-protein kinase ppk15 n=1 Tax=Psilocybe cubensis TaxID=181762 RepID=A0ACB8HD52_PSICU|nr:Serine/threonine-protein kinase ppk15 [Psilocybe cubensis]KAH9485119.1 Serine/threonine-protein kinase ppk15 [Psilocybe cubensis]
MSEPELYMPDTNESFDLPRWQTQVDPLSSSAQAAHTAQASYLYSGPPPPAPSSQRMHSVHQGQTRQQTRISQLLEQEHLTPALSAYTTGGQSQLSRSASLGGSASGNLSSSSRIRRHHQSDDLEGAFNADNQGIAGPRQQPQMSHNSFYPTSVGYQSQSLTGTASVNPANSQNDQYTDMYYNTPSHPPKRLQPGQHDVSPASANRGGRSPLRMPNTPISASPLEQYQSQYSPTTATYSYGNTVDQRTHPTTYQTHSRNHSQVKPESVTPPNNTAYSSQSSNSASYTSGMSINSYPTSYTMDTSSPHPPISSHLNTQNMAMKTSLSNPPTPLSYMHSNTSQSSQYYPQDQSMAIDPPPKRRAPGFRRVRTAHDLQPRLDVTPTGRRMGSDGTYLSPLRQLTTNILDTYRICNPQFRYESTHNPRRVLTKPSKPAHNDGYDNDDYDYILYVNDWLGSDDGHKYLILDILGQGTFGQVVKCQNMKTHEIVAVKVVKNKPAYFNQSMMELNKTCDPNDEHHILRLRDSFIHRSHLCLVFELLSSNLYELIKQNQFQGLSTQLVKVFMAQLLDAMTVLKDARLIHCDLKPENILLKSLQSPQIKVIDFGSACHERQTVYTYIQSRFYRSPEVLLAVELFLGLPLFPGTSEYNQLTRIIEMLGMPPLSMLNTGKQTTQFFDTFEVWNPVLNQNEKKYRLKSIEQYSREHNTNEQPGKQYFKATSLPEIINTAPMPNSKSSRQGHELEKELNNRAAFIDFCQGLLNLNPVTRWTPQQARLHPFITGEKFSKPFVPDGLSVTAHTSASTGSTDPKRPYGGLVPSQPKGTRAYTDAASYNQHLAQHQAYTAQAQSQAANTFRNPYITSQNSQQQHASPSTYNPSSEPSYQPQQQQQQPPPQQPQQHTQYVPNPPPTGHRGLTHQNSTGQLATGGTSTQFASHGSGPNMGSAHLSTNIPANPYIPNSRARANTINQMDTVPPALARLQHMNQDIIGGRNALTPVLNRDDAMREWERRQAGKAAAAQPYPQLELLQQQAEMAASSGLSNWSGGSGPQQRYPPPPSKLSHAYQPQTILVDDDNNTRREAVMSNVRTSGRSEGQNLAYGGSNVISSPPQAYTGNMSTTGNRYPAGFSQNQASSNFDSVDRRGNIADMYVPMQPEQYSSYSGAPPPASATRHAIPPAQTVPPSFYNSSVMQSGPMSATQTRNPFQLGDGSQATSNGSKDVRRGNGGIENWQR